MDSGVRCAGSWLYILCQWDMFPFWFRLVWPIISYCVFVKDTFSIQTWQLCNCVWYMCVYWAITNIQQQISLNADDLKHPRMAHIATKYVWCVYFVYRPYVREELIFSPILPLYTTGQGMMYRRYNGLRYSGKSRPLPPNYSSDASNSDNYR